MKPGAVIPLPASLLANSASGTKMTYSFQIYDTNSGIHQQNSVKSNNDLFPRFKVY